MENPEPKITDTSNSIWKKLKEFFMDLYNLLVGLIEFIVNSKNYYKYNISILLTLVFIIIISLINYLNINNKNTQILTLLTGGILLSIFYFFIYRNYNDDVKYNEINKKLVEYDKKSGKNIFQSKNFKNTITEPLINLLKIITFLLGSILGIVFLIVLLYYTYNSNHSLFNLTKIFIGILIGITILGIIAKIFSITLINCDTKKNIFIQILCIIKNFIFFIPCLFIIIVDLISKDIRGTSSSVYILFIILLILVLSFIGLPLLFNFISTINKNDLLSGKGPYYLDKKRTIGNYQNLTNDNKSSSNSIIPEGNFSLFDENSDFNIKTTIGYLTNKKTKYEYKYTYSISFYLYLNPQPKNTSIAYNKETELFNYGNKPVVLYDGTTRNLIIKSKTKNSEGHQLDTIYKTKNIKYQKWMFITINYQNNIIDVFIDGKLVGSKNNVPPYFDNDKITIGEDNGIHGSIKDIYYYETPRPPSTIQFIYDLTLKPAKEESNFVKDSLNNKVNNLLGI
tara:strand:- start:2916 stop:4445 length:1530 start_codon:yes stop_codon:yes gene_type:complete